MIRRYPGLRALALIVAAVGAWHRWQQAEPLTRRWLLRQDRLTAWRRARGALAAFAHAHQRACV